MINYDTSKFLGLTVQGENFGIFLGGEMIAGKPINYQQPFTQIKSWDYKAEVDHTSIGEVRASPLTRKNGAPIPEFIQYKIVGKSLTKSLKTNYYKRRELCLSKNSPELNLAQYNAAQYASYFDKKNTAKDLFVYAEEPVNVGWFAEYPHRMWVAQSEGNLRTAISQIESLEHNSMDFLAQTKWIPNPVVLNILPKLESATLIGMPKSQILAICYAFRRKQRLYENLLSMRPDQFFREKKNVEKIILKKLDFRKFKDIQCFVNLTTIKEGNNDIIPF